LQRFSSIADKNRRTYAAMVSAMDDSVGRVLTALRESGNEENTLVFFMSDNGGPTGNASGNHPLRGTKRTLYEGGVRVPFVVRWPGRLPQGTVYSHPVSSLDVFPTAMAATGAAAPKGRKLDGVNLLPYLGGASQSSPHSHLFWRTFGGVQSAVRSGPYKLLRDGNAPPALFNLDEDIGEADNLAARKPDIMKSLGAALDQWNGELAKPLWDDHIFHRRPAPSGTAP